MDELKNELLCQCLDRLVKGDISALEAIYQTVGKLMFAVAYSIVANRKEAEDIVHDSLLKIVKKAKNFRSPGNAVTWINILVRNLAYDHIRKKKRRKEVSLETVERNFYISDDFDLIYEIFQRLSERESEIIRLKYWFGYSLSEIGAILKMRKSTVGNQIKRTEEKIKNFYKNF